ncbi:MAG: mevalonate kinase [Candidatus Helarchaeales archaeon]
MEVTASAPGKIILFGEHAVVYGSAAIAIAIQTRARATVKSIPEKRILINARDMNLIEKIPLDQKAIEFKLKERKMLTPILNCFSIIMQQAELNHGIQLELESDIPIGAGLGSSAAVSVAILGALNELLDMKMDLETISSNALEVERSVHGTPSGIDNTISTHGSAIYYKRGEMQKVRVPFNIPLLILNTSIPRRTGDLVSLVRRKYISNRSVFNSIFQAIDKISSKGRFLLERGRLSELGELMNINQGLLDAMGVSTPPISDIINEIRSLGVLGVKITGAGGGGSIIMLCSPRNTRKVARRLSKSHDIIQTSLSSDGLKIEKKME